MFIDYSPPPALAELLVANAEVFAVAGTSEGGINSVSILGPFASHAKFIHGIVSR
jgi:hypothetical protein